MRNDDFQDDGSAPADFDTPPVEPIHHDEQPIFHEEPVQLPLETHEAAPIEPAVHEAPPIELAHAQDPVEDFRHGHYLPDFGHLVDPVPELPPEHTLPIALEPTHVHLTPTMDTEPISHPQEYFPDFMQAAGPASDDYTPVEPIRAGPEQEPAHAVEPTPVHEYVPMVHEYEPAFHAYEPPPAHEEAPVVHQDLSSEHVDPAHQLDVAHSQFEQNHEQGYALSSSVTENLQHDQSTASISHAWDVVSGQAIKEMDALQVLATASNAAVQEYGRLSPQGIAAETAFFNASDTFLQTKMLLERVVNTAAQAHSNGQPSELYRFGR